MKSGHKRQCLATFNITAHRTGKCTVPNWTDHGLQEHQVPSLDGIVTIVHQLEKQGVLVTLCKGETARSAVPTPESTAENLAGQLVDKILG